VGGAEAQGDGDSEAPLDPVGVEVPLPSAVPEGGALPVPAAPRAGDALPLALPEGEGGASEGEGVAVGCAAVPLPGGAGVALLASPLREGGAEGEGGASVCEAPGEPVFCCGGEGVGCHDAVGAPPLPVEEGVPGAGEGEGEGEPPAACDGEA
jgi:hypothetical protein